MKSVFALLVSSAAAVRTPDGSPIYPLEYHFNEDPHSVPSPIAGKPYMTTTQAKYIRKETWDTDTEVTDINPDFHQQFNWRAKKPQPKDLWMTKYWGKETLALQLNDDVPADAQNLQWQVTPDLGEMDDHATLLRESDKDYLIGKAKFHGWTNPLSWTDDGNDDDLVLVMLGGEEGITERRVSGKTLRDLQI